MTYYTKEQLKQIEELGVVQHFNTVLDSDYKRGTTAKQNETLADIYDAATGGKVSRHFGCKTCIMNLYRNAGQLYRKTLEYNKQKQAEQLKKAAEEAANTNTEVVENVEVKEESPVIETVKTNTTEAPKTNKRTRKKKENGNTE